MAATASLREKSGAAVVRIMLGVWATGLAGCMPQVAPADGGLAPVQSADGGVATLTLVPRFPSTSQPGVQFDACMLASPTAATNSEEVWVAASDSVVGLSAHNGSQLWRVALPAPAGQRAFAVSTPVAVGHRLVVAFHTTGANVTSRDVVTARVGQYAVVVDTLAHALDPSFAPMGLAARLPASDGGTVEFRADHALQRSALVHLDVPGSTLGRVYVTFGNAIDIQPWHGWLFELDMDAWRGAAQPAPSNVLVTTPEADCGPEGVSGSRDRRCGGGLWAPSGPLVWQGSAGPELIVAPGNGQLDLRRADHANTLMRIRPGLAFDPGCDANACATFNPDAPSDACVQSCANLFIPRLLPGQAPPNPPGGVCDGLTLFQCWQALDYIGGSTPTPVVLASGRALLAYPAKDGHLYVVDAQHLGTLHARLQLVETCGTANDACLWDWAGMAVTQPVVVPNITPPLLLVPTFMPDHTHPAGVVAVRLDETASGIVAAVAWTFPPFETPQAVQRFRRHPSRVALAAGPDGRTVALVVETQGTGGTGTLWALDAASGQLLAQADLPGPGYRFVQPLVMGETVYVPSCQSDSGPGTLLAFDLSWTVR